MPSTLGYALLGLLARRDATGYDLARRMETPIGYFWRARHSQIYPELARLESAGLVRHEVVEGAGPRPTKLYSATPAGTAELTAWVTGPLDPDPGRDIETLRVWSIWRVDRDAARDLVTALRRRHADVLADYRAQRAEVEADPASHDPRQPLFANRVTLESGVRTRTAAVEWCEWLLAELDSRGGPVGSPDLS